MRYKVTDEVFYTIPAVVPLVKKYSKGKVLDVGCGTGEYFKYFKGKEIFGMDLEDGYFKIIKKNKLSGKKIILKKADMREIPFKDETFDFVLSVLVLEYMKSEKELRKAISELKRVLKRGGVLIVVTPHKSPFTCFVREQIISRILPTKRQDPNFIMGVPRSQKDLQRFGFKTWGCLGWVTYKSLNNDMVAKFFDFIFWNIPYFSGTLIGIYKKT